MPRITSQTLTERDLLEMQSRFEEMAKKPKRIRLQEALMRLAPAINAMVAQGYSLRDVCGVMEEYSIKISESMLKKMLEMLEQNQPNDEKPQEEKEEAEKVAPVGEQPANPLPPAIAPSALEDVRERETVPVRQLSPTPATEEEKQPHQAQIAKVLPTNPVPENPAAVPEGIEEGIEGETATSQRLNLRLRQSGRAAMAGGDDGDRENRLKKHHPLR